MRPCRGRDAGSAPSLTAHTLLCGRPLTCAADPSRPAEDWQLLERLHGPEGETIWVRDGAPSMRKPSLAIREGQPLPLPSAQWPPWRLPEHVGRTPSPPTPPLCWGWVRRPRGGAVYRSLSFFFLETSLVAQMVKRLPTMRETRVRKIHCRRKWQPTPVFLPGESHG